MRGEGERTGAAAIWELGDYPALAALLEPAARAILDAVGDVRGRHVVDVAAGSGNVAAAALAHGASVTACDFAPKMIELGRQRTGPAVDWRLAPLDALGLAPDSADVVASNFGLIFAPDPAAAIAEISRVLRPGGRLGFTAWTSDGFMARMTARMREFLPPQLTQAADPMAWGDRGPLDARLGGRFTDVEVRAEALRWEFDSAAAMSEFLLAHSPTHVAAVVAAGPRGAELLDAIAALAGSDGGPVVLDTEYLVITGTTAT